MHEGAWLVCELMVSRVRVVGPTGGRHRRSRLCAVVSSESFGSQGVSVRVRGNSSNKFSHTGGVGSWLRNLRYGPSAVLPFVCIEH